MTVPLHAIDQGKGETLVLLHGFPLDHTMWRFQTEALAQKYRVIVPDLRGFGQTPIEPFAAKTGVPLGDYADDVAALLDAKEIAGPVTFVGFSMGGYILWQFYQRHRDRVRAMVMCDTRAAADTPQAQETRFKMAENVEGWGSAHVAHLMTSKLFGPATMAGSSKLVEEIVSVIGRTDPVAIAASQRGMAHRGDSTPLLPTIDVPVLYLVGVDDVISTRDEMKSMAQATPGAKFIEIQDAGHMSPMENPTSVNRAIEEFIEGLAKP
jgi:pimeloyl-ACP methyl ester carboxylesterase